MISVIMATYNGEMFISEQLESILTQTKYVDEIIIIDDCSTDSTRKILQKYKNKYKNIQLIFNNENIGHYKTFLKGIAIAEGEYIFFSDQDDIWNKEKIEKYVKITEEYNEVVFVRAVSEYINKNGDILKKRKVTNNKKILKTRNNLNYWGSGYEMMITKKIRDFLLIIDAEIIETFEYHDVLIGMLCPLIGKSILFDKVLNYHRLHENNVTQKITTKSFLCTKEDKIFQLKKNITRLINLQKILKNHKEVFIDENYLNNIEVIKKYIEFNNIRKIFIENNQFKNIIKVLIKLRLYERKKDFISDIIYAYNLNKLIKRIRELKKW